MNALRGRPLALLGGGVLLAHLWVVAEVVPSRLGEGSGEAALRRIDVAFVKELRPAAPPAAPPVAPAPRPRAARPVPAPLPASAPEPPAPPELPPPEPLRAEAAPPVASAPAPEPMPEPPQAALPPPGSDLAGATPPEADPATIGGVTWPPSTRLSYRLTGNVRGPVEGRAKVEWLRQGTRYQVFMEAAVKPWFSRRDASEGEITPEGLSPRRYELEQKAVLRDVRRQVILLEADRIRLPAGTEVPRPPGVQDAVSQFVHLTWFFNAQPHKLVAGTRLELPIALPRRVEPWTYEVLEAEELVTPAGPIAAVHVKPRREPRPGGDFVAEMWIAPSLQYLPVRIVVRQDAETYVDLVIDQLPQQAAEAASAPALPANAR